MRSAGARFPPLLAASERENTGGLGKEREQEEEGGEFMHPVQFFPGWEAPAAAEGPAQPPRDPPALQQTRGRCRLPANAGHEIQSSPGCYAIAGPPGQLRGVFEGNLSTQ